jgi:hypothetical protein
MKSRRLPETDIANVAFQPALRKEKVLAQWVKPKAITRSYEPFRQTAGDAVNQQLPLFPSAQIPTPWEKLESLVTAKCRGNSEILEMNLCIARSTHKFALEQSLTAEPISYRPITLSQGQMYDFSLPLLLRYDGGASVVFPDLRRTGRLSNHGCHVTHSVQHQRFRENFPDLAALRLDVWRYKDDEVREIEVIRHGDRDLITYDELVKDFSETYKILNALLEEQFHARRSSGSGDYGPLFGT